MTPNQRHNLLDYVFAILPLQEYLGTVGLLFEGEYRFTKKMVADYYQVEESTIDRLLDEYKDELLTNGYTIFKGKELEKFRLRIDPRILKVDKNATGIGLFNFPSLINVGMLLTDNKKAEIVRNKILDQIISSINERTGGGARYINPSDVNSLPDEAGVDVDSLDFDQIINLPENKAVLQRLKQANEEDDDDNDE